MGKEKLPSVLIDASTWEKIRGEVSYWAKRGRRLEGAPFESVFYPLAAIGLRPDRILTPFDPIELEDVNYFAVSDLFLPPKKYENYSSYSAQFRARDGDTEAMKRAFTEGVRAINVRHPQLLFLGPGHSHPFAVGMTYPSSTDIEHHIRPYRRKNEELLGCRFSLALIVVRACSRRGWQACAFAMDGKERLHDLGTAQVVSSDHIAIKNALIRPFYRTRRGRIWEARQRVLLRDQLIEHERWPGGWTSFLIRCDQETAKLLMLPPGFPRQSPLQQSISLVDRRAGAIELLNFGRSYKYYQLGGNGNGQYLTRP